jgi:hypothetical protein
VIATGEIVTDDPDRPFIAIVKFDRDTGAELWRTTFRGTWVGGLFGIPALHSVHGLAIDANDDVVVTGVIDNTPSAFDSQIDMFVGKFRPGTGQAWFKNLGDGFLFRVAVDGAGDVVAVGYRLVPAGAGVVLFGQTRQAVGGAATTSS